MPRRTASQAATKWRDNLIGATREIEVGVNNVTESPMDKAVAQQAKMEANWLESVRNGKWARNTQAVSLAEWKSRVINVGIGRIRAGAEAATPKLQRYYDLVFPQMQVLEDTIAAMPSRDLNDSIARAVAWMEGMSEIAANL